ncbi:large ribosomal subunit protein mL54-like isoform X2 [Convolutriloba macropyga]|uniref:large ribosomal subunit protein mL54-like isoform X2 n=1 Tax=Convolutriloba macropyga TaxID=536237 RepID=UPI003F5214F1
MSMTTAVVALTAVRCFSCTCRPLFAKARPGAVRIGSKGGATSTGANITLPQDPGTLTKMCVGSQVYKDKEDAPILQDDSEYPEWLWQIRKNGPPKLEELDPKTMEYWQTLIEMTYKQVQIDRPKPRHRRIKDF